MSINSDYIQYWTTPEPPNPFYLVVEIKVIAGLVGAGENVGLGLVGTGENDGLVGLGLISLITLSPVINVGNVGLGFISL